MSTQDEKVDYLKIPDNLKKVKFLIVHMMGGKTYQIDPDEYALLKLAKEKGMWVKLRQAEIFGPSISSIELDLERTKWYHKLLSSIQNENRYVDIARGEKFKEYPLPEPLDDNFRDIDVAASVMELALPKQLKGREDEDSLSLY